MIRRLRVRTARLVDGVLSVLRDAGEDAKCWPAGQSLVPLLRLRLAYPSTLVDVGGLPSCRRTDEGDGSSSAR